MTTTFKSSAVADYLLNGHCFNLDRGLVSDLHHVKLCTYLHNIITVILLRFIAVNTYLRITIVQKMNELFERRLGVGHPRYIILQYDYIARLCGFGFV